MKAEYKYRITFKERFKNFIGPKWCKRLGLWDYQDEMQDILSDEIRKEIDAEIIAALHVKQEASYNG